MRPAARAAGAVLAGCLAAGLASAGGPLAIRTNGQAYVWDTTGVITYSTDNGPLSATVNETQARNRVRSMFDVWQNVDSANIRYNRDGFIPGGDVDTVARFNTVEGDCGNGGLSPIIYDATGEIFNDVIGDDAVIGFAGPCAINVAQGRIISGHAVMNGLYQDGQPAPIADLTTAQYDATFIHEFGHFSGLDHSQINVECANVFCSGDDLAGLPTMFPFLVTAEQGTLSIDDVAWISSLYPATGAGGFTATHGRIRGTVYFHDGESAVQFANVVARRVDTGGNEDRRFAGSVVSGYRFRVCRPNPITNPPDSACPASGSEDAADIGFFEIPLPPGNYLLEVENIDPQFTGGSSVGPSDFPLPLPALLAAPVGPVTVTAGQTVSGVDIVLPDALPRFDQFESP